MPRAPERDRRPLSRAHGTTVLKSTGRAGARPKSPAEPRTPALTCDDTRCTFLCTASCANEVCTGIVHTMTTPTRLPPSVRRPHRHPPRRRAACACSPTRCARACSARLRVGGPATATDLAAALGTNSGATSYHLRKLEAVGLVTDTGEGEGKRRLWRAATDFHSYYPSDFDGDEDSETALNWLARDYVRHFSEQAERWVDASPDLARRWQDACGSSDDMVLAHRRAARGDARRDRRRRRALPPGRPGQPRRQAHRRLPVRLRARPRQRAGRDDPAPLPARRRAPPLPRSRPPAGSRSASSSASSSSCRPSAA